MPRSINENNLLSLFNPQSIVTESYRTLKTNIQFSSVDLPLKVVMLTSAQRGEGKTTTTSNLAIAYAQEGKKVLIIDTDLRDPSMHQIFSQSNRAGLTSILSGQHTWQEVITETSIENLYLITGGPQPPNPPDMLGSKKMHSLMDELRNQFDIILVDTPPVLAVTDSLILSSLVDGTILVVISGKVEKDLVKQAKLSLQHVNANIIGMVFNKINRKDRKAAVNYYDY